MIDFENELITIPASITKSARKYSPKTLINLDMPDTLVVALKYWMAYKFPDGFEADDYLFPSKKRGSKRQYDYFTFSALFRLVRSEMMVKNPKLFINKNQYALKHTGVIKLFNALSKSHKTPQEIQNIVRNQCRHSSFLQTETYLRKLSLNLDTKREKINF